MRAKTREIAASFDTRASNYGRNEWHRKCAERLVETCQPQPGNRVLDAATGTGFAAFASARRVGRDGHVCGVDVSAGMLREASVAAVESGLTNIEFIEDDASFLPRFTSEAFDVVTCAAGLLYMPLGDTLREWHRLLKIGGTLAFSTMEAGSPPAGQLFRACAAEFGVALTDPSEPLGTPAACRQALHEAGFEVADIISEPITFSVLDLSVAWESNFGSPAHRAVRRLADVEQQALRRAYAETLAREERERPGTLNRGGILYALARR
jgi:ubiquinone/menaquinone biosynthesis C-methylase UbiE